MLGSVISLSSSDEDETADPPRKKLKASSIVGPQVTVTLVPTAKGSKVETVTLDSDDEVQMISPKRVERPTVNGKDADLIMLIGDAEEPIKPTPPKPAKSPSKKSSSVLVIDSDSDNEMSQSEATAHKSNDVVGNGAKVLKASQHISSKPLQSVGIVIEDSDAEADDIESPEKPQAFNAEEVTIPESNLSEDVKESSSQSSQSAGIVIEDSEGEVEDAHGAETEFPYPETYSSLGKQDNVSQVQPESVEDAEGEVGELTTTDTVDNVKNDFDDAKLLFKSFLDIVKEKLVDSEFEEVLPKKVPIIEKYFKKSGFYVNEKSFQATLKEATETIRTTPNSDAANKAVIGFFKIYEMLKSYIQNSTIEIEEDDLPKVKKLEKIIKLLRKKIKQLEETEVNFDDEENSTYIMCDRYQNRLKKVYLKYCKYIRRNPLRGRAIYDKIQFVHSKYNVINQALSRKFRNSVEFPSYYDVERYIEKVATKEKLNLSEQSIRVESEKCFRHLGNILQKKRRQELYDSHLDFIEFTSDPAAKDVSLENTLKKNFAQGKDKLDQLYQKYVQKQELGEDHVSSDGGQSSEVSDSEEKQTTKVKTNGQLDEQIAQND